jgi:acyl-CoA synthetase (AMP-forming)/AMP-acid ligase II
MITLSDIPRRWSRLAADREALVFEEHRLSWRELDERIDRLAHAFRALGIGPGEHIAVLAFNHHRFVELYYAASRAGNVIVPLNWRLAGDELRHILDDSEAVALFVDPEFWPVVREIRSEVPALRSVVSLGDPIEGAEDYEALLAAAPSGPFADVRDENALFILMYTGGTTGKPKGVMISNRNIMTGTLGCLQAGAEIRQTDSTLMVLPLFHISLWPVTGAHYAGARVVVSRRFDMVEMLDTLEREEINHVNFVPTLIGLLLDTPGVENHDLSKLRVISFGGAPASLELLLRLRARFPDVEVNQGYGMTEAAPILSVLDGVAYSDTETPLGRRRLESAGREAMTTEVRIVDAEDSVDHQSLPAGVVGEVVAQGANIMLGYWKNPELTAERLRDGWLHTGDMGMIDEDGFIFLVGRKDDMIITGGENVYPREVEDVILTHPAVAECAVVGMPDPVWGEQVVAFVVLGSGQSVSAEEIVAFCETKLAGYKKPRRVEFVEDLPKTMIGKVSHREVRDAHRQREDPNPAPTSSTKNQARQQ